MRNDKCASGSGRFIEVLGAALGVPMEEIDAVAGRSQKKIAVSTQCAVFAESEVISYVNRGESIPDLVAGVCDSVARMVISQVLRIGRWIIILPGRSPLPHRRLEERLSSRYHPSIDLSWRLFTVPLSWAEKSKKYQLPEHLSGNFYSVKWQRDLTEQAATRKARACWRYKVALGTG